jgi:predicted lipoprotein
MSLAEILNAVTFRLQEVDDQGLRSFVEVGSYDELPPNRQEGPAAYGIASFRGLLDSISAVLGVPEEDGIIDLVREQDEDAAAALVTLVEDAIARLAALPDSIAATFADAAALASAAEVVGELKVLVGSQIATLLGVTIGFSDADGDS